MSVSYLVSRFEHSALAVVGGTVGPLLIVDPPSLLSMDSEAGSAVSQRERSLPLFVVELSAYAQICLGRIHV